MMEKRRLALIPARGGSKGIKDKNIVDVAGKPLIQYTIDVALELKKKDIFKHVLVSTDSDMIADISRKLGAEVPFLRPEHLADDRAKTIGTMLHALDFYKQNGEEFDYVVLLQPTTPLRTEDDVIKAIEMFDASDAETLISCYQEDHVCDLVSYHLNGNVGKPLHHDHNKGLRRQEHEAIYVRNGALYISTTDFLIKNELIISDSPLIYVMPKEQSINLDVMADLELLKWRLER